MRQVIAIILWDLEGFIFNTLIEVLLEEEKSIVITSTAKNLTASSGDASTAPAPKHKVCLLLRQQHATSLPPHRAHPEQLFRQVPTIIDATIHGDEALHRWLVFDIGVVQTGIEHDDGKGEHITGIYGEKGEGSGWQQSASQTRP